LLYDGLNVPSLDQRRWDLQRPFGLDVNYGRVSTLFVEVDKRLGSVVGYFSRFHVLMM